MVSCSLSAACQSMTPRLSISLKWPHPRFPVPGGSIQCSVFDYVCCRLTLAEVIPSSSAQAIGILVSFHLQVDPSPKSLCLSIACLFSWLYPAISSLTIFTPQCVTWNLPMELRAPNSPSLSNLLSNVPRALQG